MINDFKDLIVWQKAMVLAEHTYRLVKKLPEEERFALSGQMRKAAVSVPSNIAEGQARSSTKEFMNYLSIAKGSNAELYTQFLLCVRISYLSKEDVKDALALSEEVGKMLNAMLQKLASRSQLPTH